MALTNKGNTTSAGKSFEDDDSDLITGAEAATEQTRPLTADERVAAATAKAAAAAAPKEEAKPASTERAVAPAATNAVATNITKSDPFKPLDNALKVDWNTLPRIMATNGNFQNKENGKMLGPIIGMELLSIQEHWVVSPGGDVKDDEAREFLKYSDDGKMTREGESVLDAVQAAKDAGYDKAALKHRCILVGALVDPGKEPELLNELVQIDLAPNSFKNFKQFRIGAAFKIGRGLMPEAGATTVKLEAIVKSDKQMNWTEAGFAPYTAK